MQTLFLLAVAVLLPTAAGYSVVGARRLLAWYEASRPPTPKARPIEKVSRDLRRLHDQLEQIENAPPDMPAKNHRCQATRAAYLDILIAACEQLEIAAPAGRPVPDTEIYRVEVELRCAGLDVRSIA